MRFWLLFLIILSAIFFIVLAHPPPPLTQTLTIKLRTPSIRLETIETIPLETPPNMKQTLSDQIMEEFDLPMECHFSLDNVLTDQHIVGYCDVIFLLFSQLPRLSVSKRLELGNYVIWHSQNQTHINAVFQYVVDIAQDRRLHGQSRADAIDMLLRSNNQLYIQHAKRFLQELRIDEQAVNQYRLQVAIQRLVPHRPAIVQPPPLHPPTVRVPLQHHHQRQDDDDIGIQEALYEQYRRLEREEAQQRKPTVYHDPQNVHNHAINESVIAGATLLVKRRSDSKQPSLNVEHELRKVSPDTEDKWKKSLRRIRNDVTKFKDGMTIKMVFDKVCHVIARSPNRHEMIKRMAEELAEMDGLCSTGHMSRIMNILQGFDDTPEELKIHLDVKEEVYASLSSFLTKRLQEADEQIMEGMVETDIKKRQHYQNFMRSLVQEKRQEFALSYKGMIAPSDLETHIQDAVKKFVDNDEDCATILS